MDFPLSKLLHKLDISLWLNHHCVFFIDLLCELDFVPLVSFCPTLGSLWLALGALGFHLDVLWGPFGHRWAPMGSPVGRLNLFKIGYDFPNKKADIAAPARKN